ncbi:transposase [Clostridium tepidiprofundi DSM 19306]|uniref:Transposase n=1 Tax=Clostridium tepidiprofundi DSM 19306 TaxID=1121338 RepID=A0A151AMS6_9CLOT|nr:tyrosine-type recombinase/integrase [Clostridium tepidiprofundi]KYH28902.1 transposase [Clostridium tepidiprofundi DSM 19306]
MSKEKTSYRGVCKIIKDNGYTCYECSYYIVIDGIKKRKFKSGFKTAKEANAFRNDMIKKSSVGEYVEPTKKTVKTFIEEWLPSIKNSISYKTYKQYQYIAYTRVIPALGDKKLQQLNKLDVNKFLNDDIALNTGKKLSSTTLRHYYGFLNRMLKAALENGYVIKNIMETITAPKINKKEIRVLDEVQLKSLLEALKNYSVYDCAFISANTGMRLGEVLGLTWNKIDFKNNCLYVTHQLQYINGTFKLTKLKTRSSQRKIVLNKLLYHALKDIKQKQFENKSMLQEVYNNDLNLVITQNNGKPYSVEYVSRNFRRVISECNYKDNKSIIDYYNMPKLSFHDLRHTFATLMLKANVNPKVVSEILGHSTVAMTLDTYSHLLPSMQNEAMNKFNNLLEVTN